MPIVGANKNSKRSDPNYDLIKAISYLRNALGDNILTKRNLENLAEQIHWRPKYRRLYTEIVRRIITDGSFELPTNIDSEGDTLNLRQYL